MFGAKKSLTVCADKDKCIYVQNLITDYIDTVGIQHVYLDGDKVFVGFDTHLSVSTVIRILKEEVSKATINIVGGTIFLRFI